MKNRLPINIENRDLPFDKYNDNEEYDIDSSGFVSIVFLSSIIITVACIVAFLVMGNR